MSDKNEDKGMKVAESLENIDPKLVKKSERLIWLLEVSDLQKIFVMNTRTLSWWGYWTCFV